MARYDLVLFDCDGTLYNTFYGLKANFIHTLQLMGRPEMPADFDWDLCVGPPLELIFSSILGLGEEAGKEACAIYRANYAAVALPLIKQYDGIDAMLRRLYAAGVHLGIASSKTQSSLNATLKDDDARILFDCILGPTPENRKSKTQLIIDASVASGLPFDRILMVGDTYYDAEGAAQAGMDFCGVSWGSGEEGYEKRLPCAGFVHTPMEIADFVLGQQEEPVRMGNPLEASSAAMIYAKDGIFFTLPPRAEDLLWFRIHGDTLIDEVRFTADGTVFTLRCAAPGSPADISGMYYSWTEEEILTDRGALTLKTDAAGPAVLLWDKNGVRLSLSADCADKEKMLDVFQSVDIH